MKIQKKPRALKMREDGYSLQEIALELGISKSTASLWTKWVVLHSAGLDRVEREKKLNMEKGHEILHQKKIGRLLNAEKEAESIISEIKDDGAMIFALLSMIYQCEGLKNNSSLRFINSDPRMIKFFLKLLRKSFDVDERKLRACIHLHDYHDENEILGFWSSETGIPISQFMKSYRKKSSHVYTKENYQGCITIYYHSAHTARVILAFAKKLMNLYI